MELFIFITQKHFLSLQLFTATLRTVAVVSVFFSTHKPLIPSLANVQTEANKVSEEMRNKSFFSPH